MRIGPSLLGALGLALTLAACENATTFPAGVPPGPSGTPGGPQGGVGDIDAEVLPGPDGGMTAGITGSVCQVVDVRSPGNCAAVKQADMVVTFKNLNGTLLTTVKTDVNGKFKGAKPALNQVVLEVSDPTKKLRNGAKVITLAGVSSLDVQLPVILQTYYDDMHMASGVTPEAGSGLVVVHLVKGAGGLAGATLGPLHGAIAYYDTGNNEVTFTAVPPTSGRGFGIWFNVSPTVSAMYQVTNMSGMNESRDGNAFADAVTFLEETFL